MQNEAHRDAVADRLDRFAAAYLMLSRLLTAAPDDELVTALRAPGALEAWPMQRDAATERGLQLLTSSMRVPETLPTLALDFQWLFEGPGLPRAVAYESVYRSDERLHFEASTFEVRRAYEEFGLVAPRLNQEPDDHIALELSFLSHLCTRALDALDSDDDVTLDRCLAVEQEFLASHLMTWAPAFIADLAAGAETDFFRGVAALLEGTLAQAVLD